MRGKTKLKNYKMNSKKMHKLIYKYNKKTLVKKWFYVSIFVFSLQIKIKNL